MAKDGKSKRAASQDGRPKVQRTRWRLMAHHFPGGVRDVRASAFTLNGVLHMETRFSVAWYNVPTRLLTRRFWRRGKGPIHDRILVQGGDSGDGEEGELLKTDAFVFGGLNKHEEGPKFTVWEGDVLGIPTMILWVNGALIKEVLVFTAERPQSTEAFQDALVMRLSGDPKAPPAKLLAKASW